MTKRCCASQLPSHTSAEHMVRRAEDTYKTTSSIASNASPWPPGPEPMKQYCLQLLAFDRAGADVLIPSTLANVYIIQLLYFVNAFTHTCTHTSAVSDIRNYSRMFSLPLYWLSFSLSFVLFFYILYVVTHTYKRSLFALACVSGTGFPCRC